MRIQCNVADEMVEKIDVYAKQMGVSRSSLCSVAIGQYVMSMENASNILQSVKNDIVEQLQKTCSDNK